MLMITEKLLCPGLVPGGELFQPLPGASRVPTGTRETFLSGAPRSSHTIPLPCLEQKQTRLETGWGEENPGSALLWLQNHFPAIKSPAGAKGR